MKKKMILFTALVMVAGALSACGKDDTYLSGIKASDYVTLGEYKGIEIIESEPSVTNESVDAYIAYILSQKATSTEVTGRAVEEGDTVNIDYAGYKDGVAFDGGTAQGQDLTIGSGRFIPGFEDGLIGKNIGETVSLDLTFPENYPSEELAGAAVVFEVTINSISVSKTPELTDAFVQDLGIEGCSTTAEYRDYVYDLFYQDAVSAYDNNVRNDITQSIMANCIFKEPPEKMVDRYYNILLDYMTNTAASVNMDLDTYMQNYYNMDTQTYKDTIREDAKIMAEQSIMFQAIADVEDLNLSEDEIAGEIEEHATQYGYESVEAFKEQSDEETLRENLMADVVMEFLIRNADIKTE